MIYEWTNQFLISLWCTRESQPISTDRQRVSLSFRPRVTVKPPPLSSIRAVHTVSLSLRERTMMIGTGWRFSTYHSILIVMGAVFTSCTRAAYWKVGLPFVGHDKYRFSTAAPPRYNPVTRLRLALHQPSYTLPLPIRFPPILGLASTPILVIRWILSRLGTLASKKIETFELDIYDFSFFPLFFFFILQLLILLIVDLKRLQSSIIDYVECKERILLYLRVHWSLEGFISSSFFFYIHIVISITSYTKYETNFHF